jgi:hypothetical protein
MQWTQEADAILTRMWGEGRSATEIAMKFGTTKSAVLGRKRRKGLALHNGRVPSGPAWSKEDIETFTRLWNSGVSRAYIADQLNRSLPALCNMRTRLGLKPRTTGGQPGPRRPSTRRVRRPRPLRSNASASAIDTPTEPKPCQYPVSGEGRRTRFCNADVKVGSAYCPAHHYLCSSGFKWSPTPGGNQIDNGPLCQRLPVKPGA